MAGAQLRVQQKLSRPAVSRAYLISDSLIHGHVPAAWWQKHKLLREILVLDIVIESEQLVPEKAVLRQMAYHRIAWIRQHRPVGRELLADPTWIEVMREARLGYRLNPMLGIVTRRDLMLVSGTWNGSLGWHCTPVQFCRY